MSDAVSLSVSAVYMALSIALSYGLSRLVPGVIARKTLHILSSLWTVMMVYGFESVWARVIGPAAFIVINGVYAWRKDGRLDNGIVSFPVSLLIISLLYSYGCVSGSTAIASMLILGFGDGAAAVTGYLLGKTKKSMEGSISMLAVSVVALMLFSGLSFPFCLLVALLAAAAERLTPSGLDNLTVPLTAALAMEVICLFR